MKVCVKTLKGTNFEIQVKPEDTVADMKKNIETVQGADVYPAAQQMLIHQGEVLKDGTTLDENKIAENSFIVIMLSKNKSTSGEASTAAAPAPQTSSAPAPPPPAAAAAAPPPQAPSTTDTLTENVYGQSASHLVGGSNLEGAIQQILDMGGGTWDRDRVVRALAAAFNNPERAVQYLYFGIPGQSEVAPALNLQAQDVQADVPPRSPAANPLNLFPQGLADTRGSGRTNFASLQLNPQAIGPRMVQPIRGPLPQVARFLREQQQAGFDRLMNESRGDQGVNFSLTMEEMLAIERLEGMGFEKSLVLEVFFACDKNEEQAANYLLDHMHDED